MTTRQELKAFGLIIHSFRQALADRARSQLINNRFCLVDEGILKASRNPSPEKDLRTILSLKDRLKIQTARSYVPMSIERHEALKQPSTFRNSVRDLIALQEEYGGTLKVAIDGKLVYPWREERQTLTPDVPPGTWLSVETLEPIILVHQGTSINLGRFELVLQTGRGFIKHFQATALTPVRPAADPSRHHPHMSSGNPTRNYVCMGHGLAQAMTALYQGRLYDAIQFLHGVLNQYNSEAYLALKHWLNKYVCKDCGTDENPDNRCHRCKVCLCGRCFRPCVRCHMGYCTTCNASQYCDNCKQSCCPGCIAHCSKCPKRLCPECVRKRPGAIYIYCELCRDARVAELESKKKEMERVKKEAEVAARRDVQPVPGPTAVPTPRQPQPDDGPWGFLPSPESIPAAASAFTPVFSEDSVPDAQGRS